MMDKKQDDSRISPLRGLNHEDIVNQTRIVRNGLSSLRDDHYTILTKIRKECNNNDNDQCNKKNSLIEERIANVNRSLEELEFGLDESNVILELSDHFQRLEADRVGMRLELDRMADENDWLREELAETQRKLVEASGELEELRVEKSKWEFEEDLNKVSETSQTRPITPSKIPVGSWRVEEEKDINRALNGSFSGSNSSLPRSSSTSRIPVGGWRTKLPVYKSLIDRENQKTAKETTERNSRQYFNFGANSRSRSKIPSR